MMRSLFSGVSGLKNHQTRMDVIGNNISNVNTTGFKSSRVNFTDILSQNLQGASSPNQNMGGTNPKQVGLGSAVGAVDLLFTNGSVQSTGVNTDLALSSSNALFILDTGSGTAYTRNGDFQFDADGNYVQAGNGYFVQGWMANNGTIDTGSKVTNITIPSGKTMSPTASTLATYTNNLNAEVPTITKIVGGTASDYQTYDSAADGAFTASAGAPIKLEFANGSTVTVTDGTYTVGQTYTSESGTLAHTTTGERVTVSSDNSPVTATLASGQTPVASDSSSEWYFKYTTSTKGDSETASSTKEITLTSANGEVSEQGIEGTTYTVGDKYLSSQVSSGTVTATGDSTNNLVVLVLDDGSEHDVSVTKATYTVNTDQYEYTDADGNTHSGKVVGYKNGFVIGSMAIKTPSGAGAIVEVGGIAGRVLDQEGQSSTASDTNRVTLTLENGETASGVSGTTYTVGKDYETEVDKTNGHKTGIANDTTNRVKLYLTYGTTQTTVEVGNTGLEYEVGMPFKYSVGTKELSGTETSGAASADNPVTVTWRIYDTDGVTVLYDVAYEDSWSGTNYKLGTEDADGTAYGPDGEGHTRELIGISVLDYVDTTIEGFSKLSKIESMVEESDITQVDETVDPTIAKITTSITTASADNPVTVTLSDGSTLVQTSGTYAAGRSMPVVTTLPVYDTLGSVHELPVYFTLMDASTDTWSVALTPDGSTTTSWQEADGSTTTVSMPPVTLDFDTNGAFASGTGTTTLTMTNGSTTPQTVQLDFTQLTQYSSSSTIAGKANGNASGSLSSISIDKTGTITGTYTNGEKQVEAQVALQRFTNPGGLNKIGESLYEDSNNAGLSGSPNTAAALGATITPSALEMSNVDIANEFTDMIITQRGFQSNSKIITVSDEMLETLINLKR